MAVVIWQIMLDSGATLPLSFSDRTNARNRLRTYNARARAAQEDVRQGRALVSPRLAIALVSYKPLPSLANPAKVRGGYARAAKLSPERRSEIARKAALKRWGGKEQRTQISG